MGGAGGQNIEHLHTLAILSSFFASNAFVLLARHNSGKLCYPVTALIIAAVLVVIAKEAATLLKYAPDTDLFLLQFTLS